MLIELTNACNYACVFCAHSKMKSAGKMMDMDLYKDIVRQAYDGGTREIGFYMRGEPLMNKNVREYVKYAGDIGYEYIYITTNGALANLNLMKDLIAAGLNSIKFSINAGTRESYKKVHGRDDFEKVIKNLIDLSNFIKDEKLEVGLFVTFIRCSINDGEFVLLKDLIGNYVDQMLEFDAYNLGGNMYELNDGLASGSNVGEVMPCGMIFNRLHVTVDGYLSACCQDFSEKLIVADLSKLSLAEAWNCEKIRKLRRMHIEGSIPTDVMCFNCVNNTNYKTKPL
jgi:pyruvate-formate lyase-activating enzyme